MMLENEIERKIEDFKELGIPNFIPRKSRLNFVENMVSTVIGARRSGKSYRVLQAAHESIEEKKIESINNICLMDFDNPILSGMKACDLKLIQSTFLKLNENFEMKTPLLFILDEIHKINGWEEYVIDLSKNYNWRVIVTGSSSKLMKQDIATELRGKAISTDIFPLCFKEFLEFKQFNHKPASTKGLAEIRRLFDEYMKWGAFPAVVNLDEYTKEILLREYFDTMLLKDIIQRFNVSQPQQCTYLYQYLLSNISKGHTIKSMHGYLKQCGFRSSRTLIRDMIKWAVDSWLLFSIPIFSDSHKEQERNYKKIYCIDWALATKNSSVWDGHFSRSLENIVFIHLYQNSYGVSYYLTRKNRGEVDFIATDNTGRPSSAIQVSMDISQPDTLKRELEPLVATAKYFNIKDNFILTYNKDFEFNEHGIKVKVMPVWKWMLEY